MPQRRKKLVRGNVRRRVPSPVVRRLNTAALLAIGFDRAEAEKLALPTVAVHFTLVEHGYEIHVFDEGRYIGAGCLDFSGSHKISDLKISLVQALEEAVKGWRSKL
jgi:hypothetical protein